jgi:antirestriction protein ArdC
MNLLLLLMEQYENNLFITYKQLQGIGAKVKKGEKGHLITYWKKPEEQQQGESEASADHTDKKAKAVLRYYYVFNVAQCEKIPEKYLPVERETDEILSCESIVKGMPQCPEIRHKENSAFYQPNEDYVNMPKKRKFKNDEGYYSTLFHELVHSTGHASRLKRDTITQMSEFGGEMYSLEELVAEIGTCYLQSFAGIKGEFNNSSAYIQGWLSKLKNDKRFVISAASMGQKAVDFILNIKPDVRNDEQEEV